MHLTSVEICIVPRIPTEDCEDEPSSDAHLLPHYPTTLHGGHHVHGYPIQADQQLSQHQVQQEQVVVRPQLGINSTFSEVFLTICCIKKCWSS